LRVVYALTPAKGNVFDVRLASAWRLHVNNDILKNIKKCTVSKAYCQLHIQMFVLTVDELEAFNAVTYV